MVQASTNRYVILDGIRGIAALFIVVRHTAAYWGPIQFYRSYLAVDLFFLLSGFVIAHAYERKLETGSLSSGGFMVVRLIRLYPVYLLSLVLCAAVALHDVSAGADPTFANVRDVLVSTVLAVAYLPSHATGSDALYPLNGVFWSLAFEILSNALYVLLRPRLTNRVLTFIVVGAGALLILFAWHYARLDVGFQWRPFMIIAGITRSIFGIFLGVLMYRHRHLLNEDRKFYAWLAILMTIAVLASGKAADAENALIDIAAVLFVFPLVVFCASRTTLAPSRVASLLLILGAASYPLYALHGIVGNLVMRLTGEGLVTRYAPLAGMALMIALVALCFWLETRLDTPLRRRLSKSMIPGRPRMTAPIRL